MRSVRAEQPLPSPSVQPVPQDQWQHCMCLPQLCGRGFKDGSSEVGEIQMHAGFRRMNLEPQSIDIEDSPHANGDWQHPIFQATLEPAKPCNKQAGEDSVAGPRQQMSTGAITHAAQRAHLADVAASTAQCESNLKIEVSSTPFSKVSSTPYSPRTQVTGIDDQLPFTSAASFSQTVTIQRDDVSVMVKLDMGASTSSAATTTWSQLCTEGNSKPNKKRQSQRRSIKSGPASFTFLRKSQLGNNVVNMLNRSGSSIGQLLNGLSRRDTMDSEGFRHQSINSRITLTSSVEMRSIPVEAALRGCGSLWTSSAPVKDVGRMYETTDGYDMFLSHTWQSAGLGKFLSLCFIFNGRLALILGLLWGPLAAFLQRWMMLASAIPGDYFHSPSRFYPVQSEMLEPTALFILAHFMGTPLILITLLFSHHFARLLPRRFRLGCLRPKRLFLDKVCIDQDDEDMKKAGIKSLSAFLYETDTLVVLWSSQYFSRLWCVLELATWVYLQKPGLLFVPIAQTRLLVAWLLLTWISTLLVSASLIYSGKSDCPECTMLGSLAFLLLGPILIMLLLPFMRKRTDLDWQLCNFDCEAAECSNMGDRSKILAAIDEWFADEAVDGVNDARGAFNRHVQTTLRAHLRRNIGIETQISYAWVLIANLPVWWSRCDYISGLSNTSLEFQLAVGIDAVLRTMCLTPLALWLAMTLTKRVAALEEVNKRTLFRVVFYGLCWCTFVGGGSELLWLSFLFPPWGTLGAALCYVPVTMWAFRKRQPEEVAHEAAAHARQSMHAMGKTASAMGKVTSEFIRRGSPT